MEGKFKIFFLPIFLLLLSFCTQGVKVEKRGVGNEAKNFLTELRKSYVRTFNSDSSFVLYSSSDCKQGAAKVLRFFVFDFKHDSLLYKDSLANACVKWIKRTKLKVSLFPEVENAKGENPSSFVIDVLTKEKIFK